MFIIFPRDFQMMTYYMLQQTRTNSMWYSGKWWSRMLAEIIRQ